MILQLISLSDNGKLHPGRFGEIRTCALGSGPASRYIVRYLLSSSEALQLQAQLAGILVELFKPPLNVLLALLLLQCAACKRALSFAARLNGCMTAV